MPNFKTLADFRKDNGSVIQAACAQFVVLCRRLKLFSKAVVAIDGSKFKAVNTRDKNFTAAKVEARLAQVEASIGRYLAALDRADLEPSDIIEARTARLNEKIAGLREQMQVLQAMGRQVEAAPDGLVSLADPDARSMATSGKGTGMVGYMLWSVSTPTRLPSRLWRGWTLVSTDLPTTSPHGCMMASAL